MLVQGLSICTFAKSRTDAVVDGAWNQNVRRKPKFFAKYTIYVSQVLYEEKDEKTHKKGNW